MRSQSKLFILLLLISSGAGEKAIAAAVIPVQAPRAMVVSVHELASRAGVEIMKAGGNAVDAAVAVGFALAVVHPQAGNLGGGGFMLVRRADGEVALPRLSGEGPGEGNGEHVPRREGQRDREMSTVGYKAIGVPGSVAGLAYAQKKYGKLTLEQVMEPAIKLARGGIRPGLRRRARPAGRQDAGPVPGVDAHLSARWEFL